MKIERKGTAHVGLTYDELLPGHLYVDQDEDLMLRLDNGVADVEEGFYYPAEDEDTYPSNGTFAEVGAAKIVIGEDNG